MQARQAILLARKQLEDITPLKTDCGALCEARCCKDTNETDEVAGMLLYPGEENIYAPSSAWYTLLPSNQTFEGKNVPLFVCNGTCKRELRPLACRIFPLLPIVKKDGTASVRIDMRGKGICPLCDYPKSGLNPAFIEAAEKAVQYLCKSEEVLAFIKQMQKQEKEIRDFYKSFRL